MKKTLLALAVAGVIAAPAAMAEVTVYGIGHVSVGTNDNGEDSATVVNSNSSRIGFKAAEDLGGGLTGVAQMEFGVGMDEGGNVSGRNQFVGIAGGFGTILAGRHDAPIKMSTGALDVFADTVADYNSIIGVNGASDVRADNAIAYVSPSLGGATVVLAYVPDEDDTVDSEATSAAVMWSGGPLSVNLGYLATGEDFKLAGTAGGFVKDVADDDTDNDVLAGAAAGLAGEVTNVRLGVGYTMDALKVGAIYETLEVADTAVGDLEFTNYLVNAAFNLGGGNTIKASYGMIEGDSSNAAFNGDTTMMAVGFDHAFSKTTSAYVVYAALDNDDDMASSLGVVGPGAGIRAAGYGEDPTALEVGMVVKF